MNKSHSAGLFLMEMIAVILFFTICAGICIQTFAKADTMSKEASNLNHATIRAESIADAIRAADGKDRAEDHSLYWDKDWNVTEAPGKAEFRSEVSYTEDQEHMQTADIRIVKGQSEVIFEMNTKHYLKP